MRLNKIIFENRAPFEKLELDFSNSSINVLSGINGAGKTTIISYIVDGFYELAQKGFRREFENREGKYYRISSGINILDNSKASVVYIKFENKGNYIEYLDALNCKDGEQLKSIIGGDSKLNFAKIVKKIEQNNVAKVWSIEDTKDINKIFNLNLLTYFPAYRFEQPAYLNDPYSINLEFRRDSDFSGYLINPIEVTSDLDNITNWMMDIVLDSKLYGGNEDSCLNQIDDVVSTILKKKTGVNCAVGVGPRNFGATRLQIVNKKDRTAIYPTIYGMSSGELSQMCMFLEIIKQADRIHKTSEDVCGMVLIDEIDKHLHMIMQKEILPLLFNMFPNVQFLVSSHSPFLSLGLEDNCNSNYAIFDMDKNGVKCSPEENNLFREVYGSMIEINNRFYDKYEILSRKVKEDNEPLIITEGKTDWRHIKSAIRSLGVDNINGEFWEFDENFGDSTLFELLKIMAKINPARMMIGIFDRDNETLLPELLSDGSNVKEFLKDKVYSVVIPLKNDDEYGKTISIEHYYQRKDLLKVTREGRRLFLGSEFYASGNSKDGKFQTKTKNIQNKVKINGVIEEKVFEANDLEQKTSIALPKSKFAELIYEEDEFAKEFDFSAFQELLDVLTNLCNKDFIEC